MIPHVKLSSLAILLLFSFFCLNGQNSDSIACNRPLTVYQIDSICRLIDSNKTFVEGVSEGGFVNQKGGWEAYDLKSNNSDTLFRIRSNYFYYLTKVDYTATFYYFNRQVIKSIVEAEEKKSRKKWLPVYSAMYYFDNGKTIEIRVQIENPKYSNAVFILKQGQKYLDDFYLKR